jgi:hypothetical protein
MRAFSLPMRQQRGVAMINYEGWGAPPPRPGRRGVKTAAGIGALCVVVIVALLAGRSFASGSRSSSPAGPATGGPGQPGAGTSAGGNWTLGACIDPTLSLIPSFATGIRADLAQAVARLAPPGTPVRTSARPGQPVSPPQAGIDLTIREVDTTSFSTTMTAYTREVNVPAVPGLMPSRPAPGSGDYANRLRIWTQDYQTVTAARGAARTAAARASDAIASLSLDRNGSSAISACVSALLVTVPTGGSHSYLLASDLQENIAPQLHGSFHGAPLYIVQGCDQGNGNECAALLGSFTKEMKKLDVGPVIPIRPENAARAISSWIRTGQATP